MDAIGKRQPVPHRLKCKYRLRSVGFSQGFSLPFLKKGHTKTYAIMSTKPEEMQTEG